MSLAPWTSPAIARGPWLQLYLGSMRERDVLAMLREAKRLGLPGVLFHGGPRGLERRAASWAKVARDEGVAFGFAFGVDGSKDSDGSALTVDEKGAAISSVLVAHKDAAFSLINAEITWDRDDGPDDDMDEAGALRLGEVIRAWAPDAILGDQPWFAIDSHGEERRNARDIDKGGTFAGFPSDEFASWVQFRAPQVYFRNFGVSDPTAYRRVFAWHHRDWSKHDESLARLGLVRPRTYTLQAYGHHVRPQDFVDALLSVHDRPSILWWDHEYASRWPVTAACLEAAARIEREGHAPAGRSPRDAVRSWQASLGFTDRGLDGSCGWGTIERAGIARRPA